MKNGRIRICSPFIDNGMSLKEKIVNSKTFFILATKNYIEGIKNGEKETLESIEIAKKLRKDTIVLVDKDLSNKDIELLKMHTQGLKIVRTVVGNIYDKVFLLRMLNEARDVYGCC